MSEGWVESDLTLKLTIEGEPTSETLTIPTAAAIEIYWLARTFEACVRAGIQRNEVRLEDERRDALEAWSRSTGELREALARAGVRCSA